MSDKNSNPPYKTLGQRLRVLREQHNQTVAEVSGAVEIDSDLLQKIEQGERRPSEDILMLLMSHFNMSEDDSTKLWELAGYTHEQWHETHGHTHGEDSPEPKPSVVMVMQADTRIMYTDMAQVTANNYGIVLNFLQSNGGAQGQSLPVARVGMSQEHAKSLLQLIQTTLQQMNQPPRSLPEPKDKPEQK